MMMRGICDQSMESGIWTCVDERKGEEWVNGGLAIEKDETVDPVDDRNQKDDLVRATVHRLALKNSPFSSLSHLTTSAFPSLALFQWTRG